MRRPSQRRLADTFLWIGLLLLLFGIADLFPATSDITAPGGGMSTTPHYASFSTSTDSRTYWRNRSSILSRSSITNALNQRHLRTVPPVRKRQSISPNIHSDSSTSGRITGDLSSSSNLPKRDVSTESESDPSDSDSNVLSPYSSSSNQFISINSEDNINKSNNHINHHNYHNRNHEPVSADKALEHTCQHTKSNPHIITDSLGYLCPHRLQQPLGCCSTTFTATTSLQNGMEFGHNELRILQRYTCSACDENQCCQSYEHCVSCCLSPNHSTLRTSIRSHTDFRHYTIHSDFDLCSIVCRSGSSSVVHENAYKHERHHCFGLIPPSFDPSLHRGIFDFATPVSNSKEHHLHNHQDSKK